MDHLVYGGAIAALNISVGMKKYCRTSHHRNSTKLSKTAPIVYLLAPHYENPGRRLFFGFEKRYYDKRLGV